MPSAILKYRPEPAGRVHIPEVLRTPSGLALVEIQGTVHIGSNALTDSGLNLNTKESSLSFDGDGDLDMNQLPRESGNSFRTDLNLLGKFTFSEDSKDVVLIMGNYQRLRGKIVALKKPVAVLKMLNRETSATPSSSNSIDIPVVEIIRHKVLFDSRPEPVVF
ncbi:Chromosome transmission fidelity protein 8 [Sugiyamaella lignohabitans]|uniref:Chromosome transmission fidelity protein 8 n=1 Tax=Sugiyamaella lignohabitans TaxID=796027 RepID=A0A167D4L7_9ASCO|nr:Chromosome transmission fidelity protein 8 [Sugiyamaella lignohabitans]ANB12471.1 Chromosome transmission fidelity protein 8 [Sugiyamaella lignohabitans]